MVFETVFNEVFCDEIREVMCPTYPRWEKKLIKRAYGKYPATYIDVWVAEAPTLYGCLPKYKWSIDNYRLVK